ncbi:carbohydrate kinase family protein [Candidatus Parcubacteria bacterium]|nr:carbohydrate kinase family protein [Candidatus Parcubacteria bacterium]
MDVVTIGTATRDVFLKSEAFKVISDPHSVTGQSECFALGSKIDIEEIVFDTGGGATNAAVTFARQGLSTACLTRVGADDNGATALGNLALEGVEIQHTQRDERALTGYSMLLVTPAGERTVLVYRGASEGFDPEEVPWDKIDTKWFYVSSLSGNRAVLEVLVDRAQRTQAKIAFNPGKKDLQLGYEVLAPYLKSINVLLLNREEGAYFTGISFENEAAIFQKLDAWIDGYAVMTDGRRGSVVSDGKTLWRAGIYPEHALVDRTGAGDAFGSGFVAALAKGGDIPTALRLASANATSVVEYMGAKRGILTAREFSDPRWASLDARTETL